MFRSATLSSHTFNEYLNIEENPQVNFNFFGNGPVISGDGSICACSSGAAVTLFNAATGQQITRLEQVANGFEFGFGQGMSMDFNGNIIAVDNSFFSGQSGQIKLFNPKTGALIDTISNPRSGVQDLFGYRTSLSADGTRIATSSEYYRNASGTANLGVCHVFSLPSKTLLTTINNPNGGANTWGYALSLSGDGTTLAVSSPEAVATNRGNVNIYNAATGTLLRTITGPNPADNNRFGHSVSLNYDGTLLAVGQLGSDTQGGGSNNGRVYLFNVSDGSLLRTYSPPISNAYYFGLRVALSSDGSTLIVGSYFGANNTGYLYFFKTNSSTVVKSIPFPGVPGSTNPTQGGFGTYLGVNHDGNRIVTGAAFAGINDFSSGDDFTGRFYIYNFHD